MSPRSLRRLGTGASLGLLGLAASLTPGAGQTIGPPTPTDSGAPAASTPLVDAPDDVLLDVPYIPQTEALCGGAAVAMTLRYWGDEGTRPERFAPLVTADGTGIRTADLRAATADLGWTALALAGDAATLDGQLARGRPLIALLEAGRDRYHYVTVVGRVGGRIVFHDPAVSPYRSLSEEEFLEAWSGGRYWAMLVLPGTGTPDAGGNAGEAAVGSPPDASGTTPRACATAVGRGIRLARRGEHREAERILVTATRTCPREPHPLRELAALRLRQDRPVEAARLARAALDREPADPHTREILAASHYLAGEDVAALAEWNRLAPAIVRDVTLGAPTRTRNRPILALAGVEPGRPLSARALALGRKRLDLLPAAAATRLSYRPLADGRLTATAAIAERPVVPSPVRLLVEGALGVLTDRGVRLRSASALGHGELWSVDARWQAPRRHLQVSLALPVRAPVPGVVTLAGGATRETYRFGDGPADLREDRRRAGAGAHVWATPWLRLALETGLDRWSERGSFGSITAKTRLAALGDRLGFTLDGTLWLAPGDAGGFARTGGRIDWISSGDRRGLVAGVRLGARATTPSSPRSVWPGAGAGSARDIPARGHDLLDDGRIVGPLFGRRIAYGSVETVRWLAVGPLDLGLAAFLDLAAAGARPGGIDGGAFQSDVGLGIRLGFPGAGALRLDVGRGLVDGAMALSAELLAEGGSPR